MTGVPKTMQKLTARARPQRACVRHCKNLWRVLGHNERTYDNAKTHRSYSATTGVPKTMQKLTARTRPRRTCIRECKNSRCVLGHDHDDEKGNDDDVIFENHRHQYDKHREKEHEGDKGDDHVGGDGGRLPPPRQRQRQRCRPRPPPQRRRRI